MGSETWLILFISSSEFLPSNYVPYIAYRKDRVIGHGGGVLIAHKELLLSHEILVTTSCELDIVFDSMCVIQTTKQ